TTPVPVWAACQIQELAQLQLTGEPLRPAVKAEINGHPVTLGLDTGSYASLLFRSGVAHAGLHLGAEVGYSYGFGGRSNLALVTADTLNIGGLVGRRVAFLVPKQASGFEIDGVLGASVLLHSDLEFDMPEQTVRFMRSHNCEGDAVVYWRHPYAVLPLVGAADQELIVMVQVNGHPVRAVIDSGSPRSSLNLNVARSVGVTLPEGRSGHGQTMGGIGRGELQPVLGQMASFAFGDEVIHNTKILVAPLDRFQQDDAIGSDLPAPPAGSEEDEMFLGADFLRAHRVYVSESQRRIYISYEGGQVFDISDLDAPNKPEPADPRPTPPPSDPPSETAPQ
ncbi:MAG: aspartyl protease family protein, partial [Alphaproteobacteria bacterium]|nr:aspartyl protease family protein [Alphaproteobacteria bacterium]